MYFLRNTAYALKTKVVGKSTEDVLEELTSATEDNLNVPTRILQEIAEKSFNDAEYDVIIRFLWRQFTANERPWRKILKTLNLIEYLLKNGSPRFVDDIREEVYHIRLLSRYSQMENNEDKGGPIREKSSKIDDMLNDTSILDQERKKADAERRKLKNLGVLGDKSAASGAAKTTLAPKTYQGFSSDEIIKTHLKSESDDELDTEEHDDVKDKKTNNLEDTHGVAISDMINTYDLTKEQVEEVPQVEQVTQVDNLIDLDAVPTSIASIENTPVNGLKEVTQSEQNKQPSPIWNWDQKTYNKFSEAQQTSEFDWSKAPSSDNLDNDCKSSPVQNENVSTANLTPVNSDPMNKMFNKNEINMVSLDGLKDYPASKKQEITQEINACLSKKEDIDDLFMTMSMKNYPVSHGQHFNAFNNL